MHIIEASERFFNEYADRLFSGEAANCRRFCAAALVGEGSECFGFDDEISLDHDVDAGFCLILEENAFIKYGTALKRAYNSLPKEYCGIKRNDASEFFTARRGVFSTGGFYKSLIGVEGVPQTLDEWRKIPEYALATAVNGKVFCDSYGEFTKIRNVLSGGYPKDVKLKKLSARLALAAQYGQYNFSRSCRRKEYGAAALALNGFVENIVSAIYLLNDSYMPYYKWSLRGMRSLSILGDSEKVLEYLLCEETSEKTESFKCEIIDDVARSVINALKELHLTSGNWDYLEPHAVSVQQKIENRELASMHIMAE